LTRDWLPHTKELISKGNTDARDIKNVYKACIEAIKESDLVIIEDTVSNFSTGHQITLALQTKKPTLVLWNGEKHRQFKQMFIHGIDSDILQISEYTNENLEDIIRSFIHKYEKVHERNRFHLVLNNVERNYLDWAQFVKNKSRTKVIRDALRVEIESDSEYDKYLKNTKN
jgi:NAD-dependent SIR2 family protein deacetylase